MAASCCSSHFPGHTPSPVADRRPLPPFEPGQSQLRFDQATGQWVVIAARRQDRTYKPPPDQCPLCPGPTGLTSEVPAPDYDVVVFENRFPSLSGSRGSASVPDGFVPVPGVGRCEVICFSSNHTGSFAELPLPHARLVVDAWRDRTGALLALPGVEQVFCFENRGEEIGVTLAHPHGQIYGYSVCDAADRCHDGASRFAQGRQPFCGPAGRRDRRREPDRGTHRPVHRVRAVRRALAGRGAHLPEPVRAQPCLTCPTAELDGFARIYLDVLRRFDRMYSGPLPYISALHQYADTDALREGYFHVELMSIRRSATRAEILGRVRVGDGRVHHRRGARSRRPAPAGSGVTIRYSAPGRINLIGEHTDYNLGWSLPIALPQRTTVAFEPSDADALTVSSDLPTARCEFR